MTSSSSNRLHLASRSLAILCFAASGFVAIAAHAQTPPPPAAPQVLTVSANAPDSAHTVIQGLAVFDPNTKILSYCLASASSKVASACATSNLSAVLSSGDTGPAGGRAFDLRSDNIALGSTLDSGRAIVPNFSPTIFIARIATADQSFDGYFAFPLSIARASTGHYEPVIGANF